MDSMVYYILWKELVLIHCPAWPKIISHHESKIFFQIVASASLYITQAKSDKKIHLFILLPSKPVINYNMTYTF